MTRIRVGVRAAVVRDGQVLLIEFDDESGLHYNLPGGGVEPGETLHEALRREVREEAAAEVEVGRLLLVWEYVPARFSDKYGPRQSVTLLFAVVLQDGSVPHMPDRPDRNQTGVRWVPLHDVMTVGLIPPPDARLIKALRGDAGEVWWEHT